MSRMRIFFTLVLVATVAMLIGLAASALAIRYLSAPRNGSNPEATEPHRPQPSSRTIVNV